MLVLETTAIDVALVSVRKTESSVWIILDELLQCVKNKPIFSEIFLPKSTFLQEFLKYTKLYVNLPSSLVAESIVISFNA